MQRWPIYVFLIQVAGCLVAAAISYIVPWVFLGHPIRFLSPAILLLGGLHLGFAGTTTLPVRYGRALKHTIGVLLVGGSLWLAWPAETESAMDWEAYSETALKQAQSQGKPVVIDFYADWCPPCHRMDRFVFSKESVAQAADDMVTLRVDATDRRAKSTQKTLNRHNVEALPTLLFLGDNGRERRDLRLVGFQPARRVIDHLRALQTETDQTSAVENDRNPRGS